jgi:hypothetical protein
MTFPIGPHHFGPSAQRLLRNLKFKLRRKRDRVGEDNVRSRARKIPNCTFDEREAVIEDNSPLEEGAGASRLTFIHRFFLLIVRRDDANSNMLGCPSA